MVRNYMLRETLDKLYKEVEVLRDKLLKDISKDIDIGYDTGGGWHDNALYEGAIRDQQVIASKLAQISNLMKYPVFIDDLDLPEGIIAIGMKVELIDKKENNKVAYKVLGSADAYFYEDVISSTSPLGIALMGHKAGETITCIVNKIEKEYLITKIQKIISK